MCTQLQPKVCLVTTNTDSTYTPACVTLGKMWCLEVKQVLGSSSAAFFFFFQCSCQAHDSMSIIIGYQA